MTHFPSSLTGMVPRRMRLDEMDDAGQAIVKVEFFWYEDGAILANYEFTSLDRDGVSTSVSDQMLVADIEITPSWDDLDPLPDVEEDAGLQTLADADVTSALENQTVSLSLAGALVGKWYVKFESPIHEFNLQGRWQKK
ncbi:hypothetical protein ACFQ8S_21355 [Streptomyces virginiae]|uniref:hypothetical protein n=1 Tax=Streptomyces virginiae TaxID=1961 RepID=UPI0036CDC5D8